MEEMDINRKQTTGRSQDWYGSLGTNTWFFLMEFEIMGDRELKPSNPTAALRQQDGGGIA